MIRILVVDGGRGRARRALIQSLLVAALLLALATGASARPTPAEDPPRPTRGQDAILPVDVGRILELYHLTDVYGEEIWPGFDTRRTPIAVNYDDREEILVGHPAPPEGFRPLERFKLEGIAPMIREGCTRFGPRGGGWSVELGGHETAYVSTLSGRPSTEEYLTLLLHECFHVFQRDIRERAEGPYEEPPEADAAYSALLGLENGLLVAALHEPEDDEARELVRMFVAVRLERRKGLPEAVIRSEEESEFSEGTALYAEMKLLGLLADAGGIEPVSKVPDPSYRAFAHARLLHGRKLSSISSPRGTVIGFFHAQYHHGVAQGLLLDRLRPGWKHEMNEKGSTQFLLLEREFPLSGEEEASLVAAAKERFAYDILAAEQKRLVDEHLAMLRAHLDKPGRRYRVYHGEIRDRMNWKPKGPVHRIPRALLGDAPNGSATLWLGGIARLEKGDLLFESAEVPVLFRFDYVEWIDEDPATDGSDLLVESDALEEGVHRELRVTTDGFTLAVAKGRIVKRADEDIVEIRTVE